MPDKTITAPISVPSAQNQVTNRGDKSILQNNEMFRLLVESVKEYAIFVLDPTGHVATWNLGAQTIKGYTREEIVGQHFSKFYLPEAVSSGRPDRELLLAGKEGRFADEGWRVRKDGSVFWASVIITPLRNAEDRLLGFAKVTRDMTERQQWDAQTQKLTKELRTRMAQLSESQKIIELRTIELQKLSAELLNTQDEERRRLARELHDELGQQLSGLRMMIAGDPKNQEARDVVEMAISTVRNLSYLLHPPLLDDVGLRAALERYIDGLTKRSGIEISLTVKPQIFPRLPKDIEMAIFRVIQESLTNVYRHAGSDSARVELQKNEELITVRVRDYGKGLAAEFMGPRPSVNAGVGISGVRERVRQLGGELAVMRAEPGTLVEAKIPLFDGLKIV